jgi:hypothetical protein
MSYRGCIPTYTQLREYDKLIERGCEPKEAFGAAMSMCIDYENEAAYIGDLIPPDERIEIEKRDKT